MGRVALGLAAAVAAAAVVVAAAMVGRSARRRRAWWRAIAVLRDFEEGCATPASRLRHVVDAMAVEMHAGLASDGGSKLRMLLTFVDRLPDGKEKGAYYALDLGGTNLRVLRVQLGGERSAISGQQVESQPIPQHLLTSKSEELFDFIALTLKNFIDSEDSFEKKTDESRELGFAFSFPVRQTSISSGFLVNWSGGFAVEDTVGKDVVQCLQEAMMKSGLDIRVTVLVNDTVGMLALGHFHDEDTVAAVTMGTCTNACYVERTDAIIKCQGLLTDSGGMVVNIEWGNFWSSHLPRTSYDIALDDESPNRNEHGFEKMISGMYLGDITRRVLHRMDQESDVFGGTNHLSIPFILRTPSIAAMHEDSSHDLGEVGRIVREELQMPDVPLKSRKLIVRVCDAVTKRASRLTAAGIVGILKKIGRDGGGGRPKGKARRTVVAVEGGLYASYSIFREYLQDALVEILGEEMAQNVILRISEEGPGLGAALVAASYSSKQ